MFLMIVETEKIEGRADSPGNLFGGAKGRTPVSQQKFMNPD